ncbi:glycosyltransferase family 4 protein [bacterium]|nr:glycosyltransferase family 4 protein [bacterium]
MAGRVLHLLSQQPGHTGSGVILAALVEQAGRAGWAQRVLVGLPAEEPLPALAGLEAGGLEALRFGESPLEFPLPGMSDVMPYPSSRFSALSDAQLARYGEAWRARIAAAVAGFAPTVIHSHHVWLLSAAVKDVAPRVPVLTSCHATGLRQAALCPALAPAVREGCRRNERFLVPHREGARALERWLGVPPERIHVQGPGFRDEQFHARDRAPGARGTVVYVGKLSNAKGVPSLLDAVPELKRRHRDFALHLAGSGGGAEGEALARRASAMEDVTVHGPLDQAALGALMRRAAVCVLPSFYEGLPLVLMEAAACGCRVVASDLPGLAESLAPSLGEALQRVPLPRMLGVDSPDPLELPAFVERLVEALDAALAAGPPAGPPAGCAEHGWPAVFRRIERHWRELGG